jgi:hypothetical protein
VLPWIGAGDPFRTAGKDVAASSVTPPFGKAAETKKALYVVALSRSALRRFGEPRHPIVVIHKLPLAFGGLIGGLEFLEFSEILPEVAIFVDDNVFQAL